jgi:hypothetical protein
MGSIAETIVLYVLISVELDKAGYFVYISDVKQHCGGFYYINLVSN